MLSGQLFDLIDLSIGQFKWRPGYWTTREAFILTFVFGFNQLYAFSTEMPVFLPIPSPPRASVDYVELVVDDVLMVCVAGQKVNRLPTPTQSCAGQDSP